MNFISKITFLFVLLFSTVVLAQTPGFNYQALITNAEPIQIPGRNIERNQIPLGLEDITLRFSITNDDGIEYTEDHRVVTDENGMVSVIVGEGIPVVGEFSDINWDGKLKYLNVELDIPSNNDGFTFLDAQKILYIPHPISGTSNVAIVETIGNATPPFNIGELIWVKNYGDNSNSTLMIWNGNNWEPVSKDYDPKNELGLIVVEDAFNRDTKLPTPIIGDQVWNQSCECIEVFNGDVWVFGVPQINTEASNGLIKSGSTIKLGGNITEPTQITTNSTNTLAIQNLIESTSSEDQVVVVEKDTGILRTKSITSILQQEQIVISAIEGQLQFNTPQNINSAGKIDVYRNGVRIEFSVINSNTIELEQEAVCYAEDKIRIVQLY